MVDLKMEVPATEDVKVDAETLAAVDRGIKAAGEGRAVPLEEVRKTIRSFEEVSVHRQSG